MTDNVFKNIDAAEEGSVYITTRDHDFSGPTLIWNRRKACWQPYRTLSCVYPTRKGAWIMARKLADRHIGMTMKLEDVE